MKSLFLINTFSIFDNRNSYPFISCFRLMCAFKRTPTFIPEYISFKFPLYKQSENPWVYN